jgi:hypothetical protein
VRSFVLLDTALQGDAMKLARRRDHTIRSAEVVQPGGDASLPILLIEGEPLPPNETTGYFLAEASAAELAELQRESYGLVHAIPGATSV